jgi:hydrogenase-4 membrane subunit HyfE
MVIVIPFYDELVGLLGISVILSALYMLGQAYIDPTIRAIAIQSLIISALIGILFLKTGDLNLLYLALITGVMRVIIVPRIMLYQVRRFKHTLRETGIGKKTPMLIMISLSSNMAKKVMPGNLGLYLIYIMAAFIFVLLYILLVVI